MCGIFLIGGSEDKKFQCWACAPKDNCKKGEDGKKIECGDACSKVFVRKYRFSYSSCVQFVICVAKSDKITQSTYFFSEKASGEEEITYACGTGKEECAKADLGPLGKTEACICTKSLCNASPDRRAISAIAIILAAISISFI